MHRDVGRSVAELDVLTGGLDGPLSGEQDGAIGLQPGHKARRGFARVGVAPGWLPEGRFHPLGAIHLLSMGNVTGARESREANEQTESCAHG